MASYKIDSLKTEVIDTVIVDKTDANLVAMIPKNFDSQLNLKFNNYYSNFYVLSIETSQVTSVTYSLSYRPVFMYFDKYSQCLHYADFERSDSSETEFDQNYFQTF